MHCSPLAPGHLSFRCCQAVEVGATEHSTCCRRQMTRGRARGFAHSQSLSHDGHTPSLAAFYSVLTAHAPHKVLAHKKLKHNLRRGPAVST